MDPRELPGTESLEAGLQELVDLGLLAQREHRVYRDRLPPGPWTGPDHHFSKRAELVRVGRRNAPAIAALLGDPDTPTPLAFRILDSIVRSESVWLTRIAVQSTATHSNPGLRQYGLQTAGLVRRTAFRTFFLQALADPDPSVRITAAQFLRGFRQSRYRSVVRDALLGLVTDEGQGDDVRGRAFAAAPSIGLWRVW